MAQVPGFSQRGRVTQELQVDGLCMAHPSLPLNSKINVLNTLTGKEIEVTVVRNIPASANRIADLSPAAWKELGLTASNDVKISIKAPVPQNSAQSASKQPETVVSNVQQTEKTQETPIQNNQVVQTDPLTDPEFMARLTNKVADTLKEREAQEAKIREEERREKEARDALARQLEEERIAKEAEAKARENERMAREALIRELEEARLAREALAKELEESRIAREAEVREREEARITKETEAKEREEARLAKEAKEREEAARAAKEANEARERELEAVRLEKETREAMAKEIEDARKSREALAKEMEDLRIAGEAANARLLAQINTANQQTQTPPQGVNPNPPSPPQQPFQRADINIIPSLPDPNNGKVYDLQIGAFSNPDAALEVEIKARNANFTVSQESSGSLYRVIVKGIPASMVNSAVQRLGALGIKEIWIK